MFIIKDQNNVFLPINSDYNNSTTMQSSKLINNNNNQKKFNKKDNFSSKSEDKLSELNTSSGYNENDTSEDDFQDLLDKKLDLSFLDTSINDINIKEDNAKETKNNNTQSYNISHNYNNDPVFQYINAENNCKKQQLYKMLLMNNLCNNYSNTYQNFFWQNIMNLNQKVYTHQQSVPLAQSFSNISWNNNINNNNNSNNTYNINKVKKSIDKKYLINIMDIKTNKEKRTTIRMMNIPSYFRPIDLAKKIDEKLGISPLRENRVYDFIYIPFKENKKTENIKNAGYAFINFVHPKHILKFYTFFNGKRLKLKTSEKVCMITFASRQGANIKYKGYEQTINDKYMFFSDTKNHEELLTD
jgi:hypothetical protein